MRHVHESSAPVGRIADVEMLLAIVEAGSLSGGARRLGKSQSVLSRRLAAMEERLGARLLERTTRSFRLTPAGTRFHERAGEVLELLTRAEDEAADVAGSLRGRVRVSAPPAYARARLAPRLTTFATTCPEIELELLLMERYVDPLAEGFDLVVRLGPLPDSTMAGRVLSTERQVLCAAPLYIGRAGAPTKLAALGTHDLLVLANDRVRDRWTFKQAGHVHTIEVRGALRSNDAGLLRRAAVDGLGIASLPSYVVENDLESGVLVELLPDAKMASFPVLAVVPSRRHLPKRVRMLMDVLAAPRRRSRGTTA